MAYSGVGAGSEGFLDGFETSAAPLGVRFDVYSIVAYRKRHLYRLHQYPPSLPSKEKRKKERGLLHQLIVELLAHHQPYDYNIIGSELSSAMRDLSNKIKVYTYIYKEKISLDLDEVFPLVHSTHRWSRAPPFRRVWDWTSEG